MATHKNPLEKSLDIASWGDRDLSSFDEHVVDGSVHLELSTQDGRRIAVKHQGMRLTSTAPLLCDVSLSGEHVQGVFDKQGCKVAIAAPCIKAGNQQVFGRFDRGHHLVYGALKPEVTKILLVVRPITAMLLHSITDIACVAAVFEANIPDVHRSLSKRFPHAYVVLALEPLASKHSGSNLSASSADEGDISDNAHIVASDNTYALQYAVENDVPIVIPRVWRFVDWYATEAEGEAIQNHIASSFDALMTGDYESAVEDSMKVLQVDGMWLGNPTASTPSVVPAIAPQHGVALAYTLFETIKSGVVMADSMAVLVVLWILHTHLHEDVSVTPYVCVKSPTKRCGKSTLLTLFVRLTARPLLSVNMTAAALFRKIEKDRPTFLIDEFDQMNNVPTLLGILNAGYKKGGVVHRATPDKNGKDTFSVYCPKAFGLIGNLPGTLADRCIPVQLKRKSEEQKVEKFAEDHQLDSLWFLQSRILRWLADHRKNISANAKRLSEEGQQYGLHSDRATEILLPLMAIAEEIGLDWVKRAQEAAVELFNQPDELDINEHLIVSIHRYFDEQAQESDVQYVSSQSLLHYLNSDEHEPWSTFNRGRELTAKQMADILKQFNIQSRQLPRSRLEKTARGYDRTAFEDVFSRYIPNK